MKFSSRVEIILLGRIKNKTKRIEVFCPLLIYFKIIIWMGHMNESFSLKNDIIFFKEVKC